MTSGSLQTLYDRKYVDEVWKPVTLRPDAWNTTAYDDTARLLQGAKGRVLELGCGSGRLLLALADQFDELVGIDLSAVRIAAANRVLTERYPQYASKVRFIASNADEPLPFEDGVFDVVIACAVIEHVVDVFHVVDEIARVCKPNGCLVATLPNICYVKHVWALLRGQVPLTGSPNRDIAYWREHGWDGGHLHCFSRKAFTDLLANTGFVAEEWTGCGYLARLRRCYLNLLGGFTVRARRRPLAGSVR